MECCLAYSQIHTQISHITFTDHLSNWWQVCIPNSIFHKTFLTGIGFIFSFPFFLCFSAESSISFSIFFCLCWFQAPWIRIGRVKMLFLSETHPVFAMCQFSWISQLFRTCQSSTDIWLSLWEFAYVHRPHSLRWNILLHIAVLLYKYSKSRAKLLADFFFS